MRPSAAAPATLKHGRFSDLVVMMPPGPPRNVVLLVSDGRGWGPADDATARELLGADAMVVGIDLAKLVANLDADPNRCVFPDGDLENLSHFVQAYYRMPTYLPPLLVGVGDGAAFAYAMLAQAPEDVFAGALSQDFCPRLRLHKPLCTTATQHFVGRPLADGGFDLMPTDGLSGPWTVIPTSDATCPTASAARFAAAVPGAVVRGVPTPGAPMPSLLDAFQPLAAATAQKSPPLPPAELGDLPVIEVPAVPGSTPVDEL